MSPDPALDRATTPGASGMETVRRRVPLDWVKPLLWLAAVWLALIAIFRADWLAMGDQWWNSSTYNHVLLVPAILVWLVWLRAGQLARMKPQAWWPGALLFGGAGLLWLLGDFSGLSLARQTGAVAMLVASALALLGPRVSCGLAFPLAYMFFLVPFGDELVPPLQMITAFITVRLVEVSGISALIEGVFIHTPAGLFEVAEACSGVKFLIAMVAFGVLAANVCFVSWRRRIGFVALSVAVPILANGVRAWGTIFVAQYVGAERASGFDHIIYGWVFFALVIALVIALAWRYFDRDIDDEMIDAAALAANPQLLGLERFNTSLPRVVGILAAIGALVLAWGHSAGALKARLPAQIHLPVVAGWQRVDFSPAVAWLPRARGAEHRLIGRYRNAQGENVDVFFALYSGQGEGREAGGFGEGALPEGGQWSWSGPGSPVDGGKAEMLLSGKQTPRLAVTWYRTGTMTTGSNLHLKLANMTDRLLLRARPTAMLIVSSEAPDSAAAKRAVDEFIRAAGPVPAWMDRMGEGG